VTMLLILPALINGGVDHWEMEWGSGNSVDLSLSWDVELHVSYWWRVRSLLIKIAELIYPFNFPWDVAREKIHKIFLLCFTEDLFYFVDVLTSNKRANICESLDQEFYLI
jgi:hypothetical protein